MWDRPTFDFTFLNRLPPPFRLLPSTTTSNWEPQLQPQPQPQPEPEPIPPLPSPEPVIPTKNHAFSNLGKLLTMSLLSVLPSRPIPQTHHRRRPNPPSTSWPLEAGCSVPLFRPYVAKVPWHGGARAFLSMLFPRYGHYCGPNWSSGKDGGSMLWDQRPIDWLDFCCYCHDIGYDTHDQAKLLKADLAFLECLEKPRMATKGGAHLALLYRSMCIAGLRNILIPYRTQLVRLQSAPSLIDVIGNLISRDTAIRQNSE